MKYFNDERFEYKETLIRELRAYNLSYTGEKASSLEYFYAFEDDELVGALYTQSSWDWVGITKLYYRDQNVLNELINNVQDYYKEVTVGINITLK